MANLQIPVDQAILPEWLPLGLPAESKVTAESFSCAEPSPPPFFLSKLAGTSRKE